MKGEEEKSNWNTHDEHQEGLSKSKKYYCLYQKPLDWLQSACFPVEKISHRPVVLENDNHYLSASSIISGHLHANHSVQFITDQGGPTCGEEWVKNITLSNRQT